MQIYFLGFFITLLLLGVGKFFDKVKPLADFFVFLSLFPLSIVAGLRDSTIGTDVLTYGSVNFNFATHFAKLTEYLSFIKTLNGVEPGYSLINFFVSRFSDSENVFLFVLSFLSMLFLFLALNRLRRGYIVGFVIYFGFFWGPSLNLLRQSLAMTMVLFAVSILVTSNRYWASLFVMLLAMSVHQTALLGIALIGLWQLNLHYSWSARQAILGFTVVGLVFIAFFSEQNLMASLLGRLPMLSKYYQSFLHGGTQYLTTGGGMRLVTFAKINLPIDVLFFILFYGAHKQDRTDKVALFFLFVMLLDVIFNYINRISVIYGRLGMYFYILKVLSFPYLISKQKSVMLTVLSEIGVFLISMYVFYKVTSSGSGSIYPYTSQILDNFTLF